MSYWQESIIIRNRAYPRFIGGPLDGITDSPFRQLVRDFSKDELLYTEMRHVACVANAKIGPQALAFEPLEQPLNYQISANKLEFLEPAIEKILARGVQMVDLNVGCPAKNVVQSGSGSALMADPERLEKLLCRLRELLPVAFTVKIRAGFKQVQALEIAKMIEDCGIDALAIHPRLQTQKFEGRPDYALVEKVKNAIKIPVIVSGGIVNFKTAQMVYEQTGCDGYLIGRAIWARPWKLKELHEHSHGREFSVDTRTVLSYARMHLDKMLEFYGPRGLFAFRKHLPFYVRGLPFAAELRQRLVTSSDAQAVRNHLTEFIG